MELRGLVEDAGIIANLIDLDPVWRHRVAGTHLPDTPVLLANTPWPAPTLVRGNRWWPTNARPAYLRWLISDAVAPWVPTVAELQAKRADMHRAVQEAAAARLAAQPQRPGAAEARRRRFETDRADHDGRVARERIDVGRPRTWND